jgi:phosphoribosyl-ATP pyrophosphohydrolase
MATAQAEAAELAAECARADNHELGHEVCVLHYHSIG